MAASEDRPPPASGTRRVAAYNSAKTMAEHQQLLHARQHAAATPIGRRSGSRARLLRSRWAPLWPAGADPARGAQCRAQREAPMSSPKSVTAAAVTSTVSPIAPPKVIAKLRPMVIVSSPAGSMAGPDALTAARARPAASRRSRARRRRARRAPTGRRRDPGVLPPAPAARCARRPAAAPARARCAWSARPCEERSRWRDAMPTIAPSANSAATTGRRSRAAVPTASSVMPTRMPHDCSVRVSRDNIDAGDPPKQRADDRPPPPAASTSAAAGAARPRCADAGTARCRRRRWARDPSLRPDRRAARQGAGGAVTLGDPAQRVRRRLAGDRAEPERERQAIGGASASRERHQPPRHRGDGGDGDEAEQAMPRRMREARNRRLRTTQ